MTPQSTSLLLGAGASAYVADLGWVSGSESELARLNQPLEGRGQASAKVLTACREVFIAAAKPHDPVRVEVASAGAPRRTRASSSVPVEIRVLYKRANGYQVRQAQVTCRLDRTGGVIEAL